jgi:hypothetical protein
MTNLATVRPIFQNGQRLTAERLTQAFEFLRTMLRRVLLAPLSSGVAAGFDFTPNGEVVGTELSIGPGLAIDGKGRLIVVPIELKFTAAQIAAQAGIVTPVLDMIVRICVAVDDSSADLDPCSPHRPLDVEEDFKLLFIAETIDQSFFQVLNQFEEPNCVPAWADLDQVPGGGGNDCCVTLGHVIFQSGTTFKASTFLRQGVSPRFNVIRNSFGTPSIFLNELQFHSTTPGVPDVEEPGVGIPVTTLLGPKPVVVLPGAGLIGAGPIAGVDVQATRVAPFAAPYATGALGVSDPRVFEFRGGGGAFLDPPTNTVSELAAGLGGVAAVPCELVTVPDGPVLSAGEPLLVVGDDAGGAVRVKRRPASGAAAVDSLIGLSAGPSYALLTKTVVPVATAGLVKVLVEANLLEIPAGTDLTMRNQTVLTNADVGERVVARSAQRILAGLTGPQAIFAWVVHPAVVKGALTGTVVRTQIPIALHLGDWAIPTSPSLGGFYVQATLGTDPLMIALNDVIDGARIVEVRVRLKGATGHASPPSPAPEISFRKNMADGTVTLIASNTDGSPVPVYETPHDVVISGLSELVDQATGAWYALSLVGEDVGDVVGLQLISVQLVFEVG